MRNILAIGAYERDNFGDYLFYEVLKRALPEDNIMPGSVIASDMRDEYGFITIPYDFVLRNYDVDAVWVVGGEVGGVTVSSAINMSRGDILQNTQYSYESEVGEKIGQLLGATRRNARAYIPDLRLYEKNKNKHLVIQSVGLRNFFLGAEDGHTPLRNVNRLVVRESHSYGLCRDNDIKASLSPDVVHSLPKFYTPRVTGDNYILIQINKDTLDKYKTEQVSNIFRSLYETYKFPIILFAAGTANGHDSQEYYRAIIDNLDDVDIKILENRKPLEIVDAIAAAKLVIGTSLHARIVAAAYGVSRISLENEKTANYAKEWDSAWPSDVGVSQLIEVINEQNIMEREGNDANNLTNEAYNQLLQSISTLPAPQRKNDAISNEVISLDWLNYQQETSINTIISTEIEKDKKISDIKNEMKREIDIRDARIKNNERHVELLLQSKSYKIGYAITTPVRVLRRIKGRADHGR